MGTPIKIAVIGAGSAQFSLGLVKDICLTPSLAGSLVHFMDIDAGRLDMIHKLAARYSSELGSELKIESTTDLYTALTDADIAALGPKQSRVVVLNHCFESIRAQCFTADHVAGGVLAARALLELKHSKIAVIAGPSSSPDNVDRINGFLAELQRSGIDTSAMWIAESDFSPEGGWASAEALLKSGRKFTALFCANDEMAVGALSYFQQAGIAVPQEVSVLGYDDTSSAEFSAPRLTSVHIPWRDMTLSGLNELLNRCYGLARPVTREFPISVARRASLAKPPAARRSAR